MEQPAAKRPRTELQKAAFERARAAREASILRKHQMLKEAELRRTSEMSATPPDPMEEEEQQPEQQPIQHQQVEQPIQQQEVEQQTSSMSGVAPIQQQPLKEQEEEEEYDYVTFDPDEIRSQLHSTLAEVQQLRQQMEGLHGKHTELEQTFTRHNVRQANMLNFV
jgi:hypothetical protein